jgi:hypothetical protein
MHTFQINGITFEAYTDFKNVSLRRMYDNGAYDEYQLYPPGAGKWDRMTVHYDVFQVRGDGEKAFWKSGKYITDADDLNTLWYADIFYRDTMFRLVNGLMEVLPEYGGSSFKDGYHPFSQAGQPQQPVVFSYAKTDSNYIVETDAEGNEVMTDQNTGTVTVQTPTEGTAPFEYSLVAAGQPDSFGSELEFTGLAAGEYSLAVRDSQSVPTLDAQGNVIMAPVTQRRKIFIGQGNDVTV